MQSLTRRATMALLGAATAATFSGQALAQQPEVTLRLHQMLPQQAPLPSIGLIPWAEKIEKESGGRIKIQLFHAMQLGGGSPATLFDQGLECGVEANSAKYLAAEAGYEACQTAVMSMGGMGYAQEYHVERYLREVMIPRIAPVSPHQIMNFIAERVLGLPKSY